MNVLFKLCINTKYKGEGYCMIEKNIYLYGAGTRCHALYSLIKEKYKKIIIIDGNPEKWGSNFEDNNIKKMHIKRILILLMKLCSLQQDIEDYLELASILCTR